MGILLEFLLDIYSPVKHFYEQCFGIIVNY